MGYEPTSWKKGDVITAEKLNKLEDGVASSGGGAASGGLFIIKTINYDDDEGTFDKIDKTFDEIMDAVNSGMLPIIQVIDYNLRVVKTYLYFGTNSDGYGHANSHRFSLPPYNVMLTVSDANEIDYGPVN